MAAILARKGYDVTGIDINEKIVKKINRGVSPINENGLDALLKEVAGKNLRATTDPEAINGSDIIFIIVQTPIDDRDKIPDLRVLETACETVSDHLQKGQLVILESTIPPGTIHEIIIPILERSGLCAGEDFYLAYSPERAIPTKTLEEIVQNSRIIGGINEKSARLAKGLYGSVTSGELLTGDIQTAEVIKLIENTYRDVNIALANEIALFCEKKGIDAAKAIDIANRHPRVNIHAPGPGVGGHCIPKDPYFLIHEAEKMGMELKLIKASREINESMPGHVIELIRHALKSINKEMKDSRISILGIAYKGNTDDVRKTPSEEVIKKLMPISDVFSHDPFVSKDFGGKFSNDLEEVVSGSDCIVVMTDHDEYKNACMKKILKGLKKPCVVVDGRRVLDPKTTQEAGIKYFGVGY
jgi:UDP-N-acetyl-D-mannosaminuronic acid dehydrogenase